jgi:hypothetical protein
VIAEAKTGLQRAILVLVASLLLLAAPLAEVGPTATSS